MAFTGFRWRPSFYRLRWRLTLSYTLFTVAAILLLELIGLMAVHAFFPYAVKDPTRGLIPQMERMAEEAARFLPGGSSRLPDRQDLLTRWEEKYRYRWRERPVPGRPEKALRPYFLLLDGKGETVGFNNGIILQETIKVGLTGRDLSRPQAFRLQDGRFVASVPVLGEEKEVLGTLVAIFPPPRGLGAILSRLFTLPNTLLILLVAGLVGAVFGFFTGGWLTRRLKTIAAATAAWGRGDFSVLAQDETADEIGELARRLNKMAKEFQELLQDRARLAVVEERNRLARDLHDSLTQVIYSLNLYSEAAGRLLAGGDFENVAAHLAAIRDAARQALREMRLLVFALRPQELEQEGLVAALQARLEAVEARAGMRVEFKAEEIGRLTPMVEEGLYRIAQEALNNILKHAQATQVKVTIRREGGVVFMEIADDGIGFHHEKGEGQRGWGLAGMAERAAAIGGHLTVESLPQGGTVVRVEVQDG